MRIMDVIPKESCVLYVKTDEGKAGLFDVKPYLESEAFAPLKDQGEFSRVHNGGYYVEWDCGADLSLDTIQARWIPDTQISAQQGVPTDARNS